MYLRSALNCFRYGGVFFHLLIVFFVALASYLFTIPHTVTLEDDGLFILSSYFNGIAHPPGYPLHTFFGYLFSQIPLGSIAFRIHLLSAVFAAFTAVVMWLIVWEMLMSRSAAYIGSLAFAWSASFWSQAIVAEVYTLNCLLISCLLLLSLRIGRSSSRQRKRVIKMSLLVLAFLYGLSLTNHWPLVILSSLTLAIILLPIWRQAVVILPLLIFFCLLGLTPYLWLYFHSHTDLLVSFYGPISDLNELRFFIGREGYRDADVSETAGLQDKIGFVGFFAAELLRQMGGLGLVVATLGFIVQWQLLGLRVSVALLLLFLCNSLLLIWRLGFDYDEFYMSVFSVYPLISYMVLTCWLAIGIWWLVEKIQRYVGCLTLFLWPCLGGLVLLSVFLNSYPLNERSDYDWARSYAMTILDALDKNAVLIADGDISFATTSYLRYVENYRPDVDIYNSKGFVLKHRLFRPFRLDKKEEFRLVNEFIELSSRPIYTVSNRISGYGEEDFILFKRLHPGWDEQRYELVLSSGVIRFLYEAAIAPVSNDSWTRQHRRALLAGAVPSLLRYRVTHPVSVQQKMIDAIVKAGMNSFEGRVEHLAMMLVNRSKFTQGEFEQALTEAKSRYSEMASKAYRARYWVYRGDVADYFDGDLKQAFNFYQEALLVWRHPNNPAKNKLIVLFKKSEEGLVLDPDLVGLKWLVSF